MYYVYIMNTYFENKVSKNCAEWGKPSTSKSRGNSLMRAAKPEVPNFEITTEASRYCLPSARTSTFLSTEREFIGEVFSLLIRSQHSRISLHRSSEYEWFLWRWSRWVSSRWHTDTHTTLSVKCKSITLPPPGDRTGPDFGFNPSQCRLRSGYSLAFLRRGCL